MYNSLHLPKLFIITFLLTGCSLYDRDFHCPPVGAGVCQPLDKTYQQIIEREDGQQEFRLQEI